MNVYDFDHTIYDGDSSLDFACFCMRQHWWFLVFLPVQLFAVIGIKLKILSVKRGKELFFIFLKYHQVTSAEIMSFWQENKKKITAWYEQNQKPDDLIISASPDFLLKPFIEGQLGKKVIATAMDAYSGKICGNNCKGKEKVRLFQKQYSPIGIDCFYSDSLSDTPLAQIANQAYLVRHSRRGTKLYAWNLL